jgi:hypothetical protein
MSTLPPIERPNQLGSSLTPSSWSRWRRAATGTTQQRRPSADPLGRFISLAAREKVGHLRLRLVAALLVPSFLPLSLAEGAGPPLVAAGFPCCCVLAFSATSSWTALPALGRGSDHHRRFPLGEATLETSRGARREHRWQRAKEKWESSRGRGWRRSCGGRHRRG